ncbi:MAG: DoxX-like family protein [Pseudorhodobacter sp.]
MWLVSGLLGLMLPVADFSALFAQTQISEAALGLMARLGGVADLALGLALLRNWQPRLVAWAQIFMVLGYSIGLTLLIPHLWFAPFGELLKNLPILVLLLVHLALIEER